MHSKIGPIFGLLLIINIVACEANKQSFVCRDSIDCVDIAPGAPIKIGALMSLSGETSDIGVNELRGVKLALAEHHNKLLEHPIEITEIDSYCSAEGGTTAALKIASDPQFVGVIGTTCSGAAITASKILSNAGLVMISGGNTAPSLTSIDGLPGKYHQKGYFRTIHNDLFLGKAVAEFAFKKIKVNRAATINDGDPYSKGLTNAFEKAFKKLGGQITMTGTVNKEDTNMEPMLTAITETDPQLLFFPLFSPAGDYITLQSNKIKKFETIARIAGDGLFSKSFYKNAGVAGINMYFALPAPPEGPAYTKFVSKYKNTFKEEPISDHHAYTYDAMNILLNTIKKVAILETNGSLHIGRQALRDALYATKDYHGLTGTMACDRFGDCGVPRFKIIQIDAREKNFDALKSNIVYKSIGVQHQTAPF